MDLAKEIYSQILNDIATLETMVRDADLRKARTALLPIAPHSGEIDHVFDELDSIELVKLDDQEALDSYLKIIKPQFHSQGLSPRAARRSVGYVHIHSDRPDEITKLVDKINKQKQSLQNMFGLIESLRQRQKLWKHIQPGVMPLTVYRQLYLIDNSNSTDSLYFSWSKAGFSQRAITIREAENIIKVRSQRLQKLGFISEDIKKIDIAKLAHADSEKLILRRPTKVHPIAEYHQKSRRATTPILILQNTPLTQYGELNDYTRNSPPTSTNYSTKALLPVVAECHIYQKK